jgi:ADP-heptose:LPS heptosyltransferase
VSVIRIWARLFSNKQSPQEVWLMNEIKNFHAAGSACILPNIHKILVLRPNAIGDFMFCLPALAALKAAYPDAHLSFVGKSWHADFMRDRPSPIDEVLVIPPVPGISVPPDVRCDEREIEHFCASMRKRRYDLAVQIYGGGRYSNPFIKRLGARHCIGLKAPDAEALDRSVPFVYLQNERLRFLEVVGLAGARTVTLANPLVAIERDREEAARVVPERKVPLVILQPGASDVRRHWPTHNFAWVGDALASRGMRIVMCGIAGERHLVADVIEKMRAPAIDLTGKLSLSGLCGLLERASLLISNDTGPLHLAVEMARPCVGIYWLTNLLVSGPLNQARHRAAMSIKIHCPICGQENVRARCEHDVCFVDDIAADEVLAMAEDLLDER